MTSQKGILSIDLIPAAADYVAYMGLSFAVSDHIVVSCTPATVTRVTQPTTCTASSSNANLTLQLQQWRFVGGSNGSIRVNETTQSTTWAGMLAVGGTVEAIGTLSDGASVDGLAVVGVTPRNWAAMPADVTVFETTSLLPERPSRIGELGNIDLLPTTGRATLEGRTAQVPRTDRMPGCIT